MVKVLIKQRVVVFFALVACVARGVDNPLGTPLEGAMTSHGGLYYAMDGATNGHVRVSEDLVTWSDPVQILPNAEPGPYDLLYRNGLFHLLAEGTGVAVSDDPLKPFALARKSNGLDEQTRFYQDSSGALFSVNRRAGSKREGEIWLQRYASPWRTVDKPRELLDGRRGQWDSLDSADLGQPEILRHRGNYYLLYAANNASPRTGLREVGVAVNENPTRFENEDKATDPALTRNADVLSSQYETLLPSGEFGVWRGRYTPRDPGADWMSPNARLTGWRSGDGGFGSPDEVEGAQLFACRTEWTTETIHIRRSFDCPRGVPEKPVLNIRHEGPVWVYINGALVHESAEPSIAYSNIDLSEAATGVFRESDNLIAVKSTSPEDATYRFIDFGLMDAREEPVLPAVYGLNRPRVITGPNGFERWMTYHAWWNGKPGRGLDRVFFFDEELYVDGPTTAETPGYHPPPAEPTFRERFNDSVDGFVARWKTVGGAWSITNQVCRQSGAEGVAKAYLKRAPMTHYLFELDVRIPPAGKGRVGVVAWSDGVSDLIISIHPKKREWSYHIEPGTIASRRFKLPKDFQFLETPPGMSGFQTPTHRLRVTKNGGYFDVSLNGVALTEDKPIITKAEGAGVPGLYCESSPAEFDSVTYTIGWDEHDESMTGWGAAADGTSFGGDWRPHRDLGLWQRSHSKVGRAFKGDRLDQYEFTVNARLDELEEGRDRHYGVFPVFIDKDNWLKAMIDTRDRHLIVTGMKNGREIRATRVSLGVEVPRRHLYDKTTAYRDITSWVYELRSESIITGLRTRWLEGDFDHLRQRFYLPVDEMLIRYARLQRGRRPNLWEDGRFVDADEPRPVQLRPNVFNEINIREEEGNFVGFGFYMSEMIVVDRRTGEFIRYYTPGEELGPYEVATGDSSESDTISRPQFTVVQLAVESSYFFRCVKLHDRVIIELNGRPMAVIEESWPASQVGIITEGQPCYYGGTTLHHLPRTAE